MPLEKRNITSSRLVLGFMGFGGGWDTAPITKEEILRAEEAIDMALTSGITMFDHADIYKLGKAEKVFGKIIKANPHLRERMTIQSKCGIRFEDELGPSRYDFSKEHILKSVDGILQRLAIEYLDILLLHRPDPLIEPDEVAEVFQQLKSQGKVRHFGVSNMNQGQIELIQSYTNEPIIVNQLEMSLKKIDWLEEGVFVNQEAGAAKNFAAGLIEYSRLHNIQIQAWSPLAKGLYSGEKTENLSEADFKTRELIHKMAKEKETTKEAIILGWLMRHPMKIQPVIGTTSLERIKNSKDAVLQSEQMTREEWYALYVASRGNKLP